MFGLSGEPHQDQGPGLLSDGAPHNGGGRRARVGHQPKSSARSSRGAAEVGIFLLGGSSQQRRPVTAVLRGGEGGGVTVHQVCTEQTRTHR